MSKQEDVDFKNKLNELKGLVEEKLKEPMELHSGKPTRLYVSNRGDITMVISRFDERNRSMLDQCRDMLTQLLGLQLTRNIILRRGLQLYYDHMVDLISRGANLKDSKEVLEFFGAIAAEKELCKMAAGR